MKAVRIHAFGGPNVMQVEEVARPVPAADELLIKMYATSVNPADYVIREGGNDFLKPYLTLPLGLGFDAAGIVDALGADVTDFQVGDAVYGVPNGLSGSYAEYIAAKASQFARKPASISFNEAGALPCCALIAWNGIVDLGRVEPGQHVLIHGAAGGVGSLAVQLAKARGAYVIGTASAQNHDFLRTLGADEVIDYKSQRFEDVLRAIDMVFNASPVRDEQVRLKSAQILQTGGTFVCTQLDSPFSEAFQQALAAKQVTSALVGDTSLRLGNATPQQCLAAVADLVDAGKVKAIVSRIYPLAEVAAAHRESETKHVRGKLVLEIRQEVPDAAAV
jgi:NADPH:quinone reductase-like Zn-dependent oxidoreductase